MKKNFLLLFWFISIITFSQEYHFDYFIQHSTITKSNNQKWFNEKFYNSKDKNLLNLIILDSKIIAVLNLEKEKIKHVFKINQSHGNISFTYKYSSKFVMDNNSLIDYNKEDVVKVKRIDSLTFNLDVYKDSKLKTKKFSAIINLEKSDLDYLKFNKNYTKEENVSKEIKALLNPNNNYIIKSAEVKNTIAKIVLNESVENIQKINLNLEVPENLIYKDFSYTDDFED